MSFLFGSTKTTNTTPTLTGQGQSLFNNLSSFGSSILNDPTAGLEPIKTAAMEGVNRSYGNIPAVISKQMAGRGYGSSGSFGNALYQTQLSRLGDLSSLNGQFAQLASQRQMQAGSLMDNMLNTQVGSNSVTKTEDPMAAFSALGSLLMMGGGFSGGSGFSETSTPGSALPTTGYWGDFGGEYS